MHLQTEMEEDKDPFDVHFKTEEELQFLKKAFKAPHAEALVAGRLAAG